MKLRQFCLILYTLCYNSLLGFILLPSRNISNDTQFMLTPYRACLTCKKKKKRENPNCVYFHGSMIELDLGTASPHPAWGSSGGRAVGRMRGWSLCTRRSSRLLGRERSRQKAASVSTPSPAAARGQHRTQGRWGTESSQLLAALMRTT